MDNNVEIKFVIEIISTHLNPLSDRKLLNEIIQEWREGDVLLTWHPDRLTRRPAEVDLLMEKLPKNRVFSLGTSVDGRNQLLSIDPEIMKA